MTYLHAFYDGNHLSHPVDAGSVVRVWRGLVPLVPAKAEWSVSEDAK